MGIWKKQQSANSPSIPQSARAASRQRADDIRRKAQCYTDITEQTGNQGNDQCKATQKRKQAEREMAALRSDALQARRLATQIENLHQPAQVQRKGRIMDTTTTDPGQAQRMTRRTTDNSSSSGGKLSFNPLHPSMELPPEQLIRLLGLENKTKRRRKQPPAVAATRTKKKKTSEKTPASEAIKLSLPKTAPVTAERERDTAPLPFETSHKRLVVPSLIAGAVAGIVISAYLFLSSPEEDVVPAVTQTTPGVIKAAPAKIPAGTASKGTVKRAKVVSQAQTEAEEKRLRNEAEHRFAQRMAEQKTPDMDIALPAATEPAVDASISSPSGSLDATSITADNNLPTAAPTEDATPPATVEMDTPEFVEEAATTPAASESEQTETTVLPESAVEAATPVEVETEPDVVPETKAAGETVEATEADVAQDSVTEETVSDGLF
jgi:hypothetical protein